MSEPEPEPQASPLEDHCGYLAILPNDPATGAAALEAACRALTAPLVSLRWMDSRVAELEHPQLPTPLEYAEIAAWVRLETVGMLDVEREAATTVAFEAICASLMEVTPIIGNAELVHCIRCPMPLLPAVLPAVRLPNGASENTAPLCNGERLATAAAAFTQYGLLLLRKATTPSTIRPAVEKRFEECLTALRLKEQQGKGAKFSEIMQRDANRYDCQLNASDTGSEHWLSLARSGPWVPLVEMLLAGDCHLYRCGVVVSLPGAKEQYWHSDGAHVDASAGWADYEQPNETETGRTGGQLASCPLTCSDHTAAVAAAAAGEMEGPAPLLRDGTIPTAAPPHAICVFIPLVALDRTNGYTEFWAGSQHYRELLEKKGMQSLPGGTHGLMDAGDCLLYDFRTVRLPAWLVYHHLRQIRIYLDARSLTGPPRDGQLFESKPRHLLHHVLTCRLERDQELGLPISVCP